MFVLLKSLTVLLTPAYSMHSFTSTSHFLKYKNLFPLLVWSLLCIVSLTLYKINFFTKNDC